MGSKFTIYSAECAVATIQMNRPDALNALNEVLRTELLAHLAHAELDVDVRVIVLTGLPRAFSAGADLTEPVRQTYGSVAALLREGYQPLFDAIAQSTKPVIAAVEGVAAGIGMSLALQCDLLLMSARAQLFVAFAGIGLVPDGGATWHLVQALGYRRAYQAIIESRKLAAQECLDVGLANRVLEGDDFRLQVQAHAESLARCAPLPVRHSKQLVRAAVTGSLPELFSAEAEIQSVLAESQDAREAQAAFLAKRPPIFQG